MKPGHVFGAEVGILGGGQLARMLAQAAQQLGLSVRILTGKPDDPAAQVTPHVTLGALRDPEHVARFLEKVDIATFESEFTPIESLRQAVIGWRGTLFPSLEALSSTQSKLNQKRLLNRLGIPTAAHIEWDEKQSSAETQEQALSAYVSECWKFFSGACVFKWGELGYDGLGTGIVSSQNEAMTFLRRARAAEVSFYCEQRVDFRAEVAQLIARSASGEFISYPLVVTEQKGGVCRRVLGPAQDLGISVNVQRLAAKCAREIAENLGYVGVLAVEFFLTEDDELLVNELAPRVHNSGHVTMNLDGTSQFENHWRAGLGLGLGRCEPLRPFGMLNLLGPEKTREASFHSLSFNADEHLHWYGKVEWRARRKMGHLNLVGSGLQSIEQIRNRMDQIEAQWYV